MINKLLVVCLAMSLTAQAQTKIEKTIPIQPGQKLTLNFDYPELKIQTWDKKEILIKGVVSINNGENDNAFEMITQTKGNVVSVTSSIKDRENIPKRIVIKKGDEEYLFKASNYNDPAVQKFLDEHGREYTYMSSGIIKEINLEIFIPKGIETLVEAKYGLVEIKDFNGLLTVDAKYGGVDATISPVSTGELIARTQYGEILTNLDLSFDSGRGTLTGYERWTVVTARPGNGSRYTLESKYGKVYLRKPAR